MGHQLWARGNPWARPTGKLTAMEILLSDNMELLDGLERGSFRFSPIDNPPIGNNVKAGRAVPLKWSRRNSNGGYVVGPAVVPGAITVAR